MKIAIYKQPGLYLLSCILYLLLTSCGFHLRGSVQLPPQMDVVYIQGGGDGLMVQELRRALNASGARLVNEVGEANAILEILRADQERRVLSVGSSARVQEYELNYTVEFAVLRRDGSVLVPEQSVRIRRDYRYDENDVLGKSSEEDLIRKEMERDMAHTMMRKMRAGK